MATMVTKVRRAMRSIGEKQDSPAQPAAAEWQLQELLAALPVAAYATDADGKITAFNRRAVDLWGVEPELGQARWCGAWRLRWPGGQIVSPSESPLALALAGASGSGCMEAVVERPDGSRIPILSFPVLKRDAQGRVVGAMNTLMDISEQKRVLDAQPRLAAIVASSHDAIISKDLNGTITSWNGSAERVFGYTAEEIIGRSVTTLIPHDRRDEEPVILSRIRNGEVVDHFETIRLRKDGRLIPISLTISPVRNEDGEIVGISKIARDITDQMDSEQRIRALLLEVNHRVKNQFAVILSMVRETNNRTADPVQFERLVRERVMALSRSHDLLVQGDWRGASTFELIVAHIRPFGHEERVTLSGPSLTLQPMAVQYLGIAFHELAMNSARFGALSGPSGHITVEWSIHTDDTGAKAFRLCWSETDGYEVEKIGGNGFGRVALERVTPAALGGQANLTDGEGLSRLDGGGPTEFGRSDPACSGVGGGRVIETRIQGVEYLASAVVAGRQNGWLGRVGRRGASRAGKSMASCSRFPGSELARVCDVPGRHDGKPRSGSSIACLEHRDQPICLEIGSTHLSQVLYLLEPKLFEKLVMAKIETEELTMIDDPLVHDGNALSFDRILDRPIARDQIAQALVQQHDERDHCHRVDERNVGIEHGIADGRAQRNDQEKLDKGKLPDRSAPDPADQHQRVDVDNARADGNFQNEQQGCVAQKHARQVKWHDLFGHGRSPGMPRNSRYGKIVTSPPRGWNGTPCLGVVSQQGFLVRRRRAP